MTKCWYCNKEIEYSKDKDHKLCEEKSEKMYALSRLLEERIITIDEYKELLQNITGYQYVWNPFNRNRSFKEDDHK